MKKLTIFLVMSVFAFGLFAIDMSVGGGFAVSPSFYTGSSTVSGETLKCQSNKETLMYMVFLTQPMLKQV